MFTTSIPETISDLQRLVKTQNLRISQLEEMIRYLRGERFGSKSEQLTEDQLRLFNLSHESSELTVGPKPEVIEGKPSSPLVSRNKTGRRPLPKEIERVRVEHDLNDAEKQCPCGCGAMTRIGEEISEKLHIIPMQLQVLQDVRFKYACKKCAEGVHIASLPEMILPKSNATPDFLAHVAVSKFEDATPLYRMCKIFHRHGFEISRATLAGSMIKVGEKIQPLVNLIQDELLEYDYLGIDETPFQVLKEANRNPESQSFMWVLNGGPPDKKAVLFRYEPHKSQKVLKEIIDGFKGYLQSDGGTVYGYLETISTIRHVGCFAHARRKFFKVIKNHPTPDTVAGHAILQIRELYRIESDIKDLTAEEKYARRQERAVLILNQMKSWLDDVIVKVPPESLTGRALKYMANQWKMLVRYTEDGRLNIDNNPVERAIRPFVVGRKNWLFSDTPHGAHANANLYTLIETAKVNGVEPFHYLKELFKKLPYAKTLEDYEKLLPWNI